MSRPYLPNQTPAPRGPRPAPMPTALADNERITPGPLTKVQDDVSTIKTAAVVIAAVVVFFTVVTVILALFIAVGVHNLNQNIQGQTPCQITGGQGC